MDERQGENKTMTDDHNTITPEMTVLDIISIYRKTEAVFKKYDEEAGECICCHTLFDSLEKVAEKYAINLQDLSDDLKNAAEGLRQK